MDKVHFAMNEGEDSNLNIVECRAPSAVLTVFAFT